MNLVLLSLLMFIVALGILVTVHEFGHFWVARRLGVKVLRFSVGFGRPLLRFQRSADSPEYVVAAIPLGGYVKMLDEREGPVEPHERSQAFNNKSVWARIAVVCAGPAANIVLAVLVFSAVYVLGITGLRPVVGEIRPDSVAAHAGFELQDEIRSVAGQPVRTWQEARLAFLDALMAHENFAVAVKTADGAAAQRLLQPGESSLLKREGDIIHNIGLVPWWPPVIPLIHEVRPGSAADNAGLQAGDRVHRVAGNPIESWREWVDIIEAHPGEAVELEVERGKEHRRLVLTPSSRETEDGKVVGFAGVTTTVSADVYDRVRVEVRYPVHQAFVRGLSKTWDMTLMTFEMIGELISGRASVRNISGPITIAEYAGRSASIDLSYYLDFIAFISVSLAVLNILPIPLLDGGHLLYYLVELVKGSPVSESTEAVGQRVGIVILACLIVLAFYNDITRLFG